MDEPDFRLPLLTSNPATLPRCIDSGTVTIASPEGTTRGGWTRPPRAGTDSSALCFGSSDAGPAGTGVSNALEKLLLTGDDSDSGDKAVGPTDCCCRGDDAIADGLIGGNDGGGLGGCRGLIVGARCSPAGEAGEAL